MSQQFDNYLFFDRTCAEAMRFYEKTLGGKIEMMMTHADMPAAPGAPPLPAGSADLVMHCRLVVDGRILMASDWLSDQAYPGMHGFAISLSYPDVAKANAVFAALAQGGSTTMPMAKTFWVEAFGMAVDRFGTPWMVNGGKPASMPGA